MGAFASTTMVRPPGTVTTMSGRRFPSSVATDCWTASASSYRYSAATGGTVSVRLRVKPSGAGDISVATRGAAAFAPSLPLAQDPSLTVQLRSSEGTCWSAAFAAPASRNDAAMFKDASD